MTDGSWRCMQKRREGSETRRRQENDQDSEQRGIVADNYDDTILMVQDKENCAMYDGSARNPTSYALVPRAGTYPSSAYVTVSFVYWSRFLTSLVFLLFLSIVLRSPVLIQPSCLAFCASDISCLVGTDSLVPSCPLLPYPRLLYR